MTEYWKTELDLSNCYYRNNFHSMTITRKEENKNAMKDTMEEHNN